MIQFSQVKSGNGCANNESIRRNDSPALNFKKYILKRVLQAREVITKHEREETAPAGLPARGQRKTRKRGNQNVKKRYEHYR